VSSWLNLDRSKRRPLNAPFALNRRILKAFLLKESLSQLWNYTYEGARLGYLQSWIDQLQLAAAETDGETSPHVAGSSPGHPELLPDEGTHGCDRSGQPQHQSVAPPRHRGYRDMNYLLLQAQRLAATKTELVVLQKAA
jgi:hypothetical protein